MRQIEQDVSNKINRNDPCICGSGLKYKKCCINKN
ncbi:MAG: SEC-C metal-binding domain-containing protein [Bacteroidota bacterium]